MTVAIHIKLDGLSSTGPQVNGGDDKIPCGKFRYDRSRLKNLHKSNLY